MKTERMYMMESTEKACPEAEYIGRFVERQLENEEMARIALHVSACRVCREKMRNHALWVATIDDFDINSVSEDEIMSAQNAVEKKRMRLDREKLWLSIFETFKKSHVYMAAADGQTPDQIQHETALRSGFIHFASCTPRSHEGAWHARLAIPTAVTDETCLRLQVFDSNELPVPQGILIFCGVELEVKSGRAFMPIKMFRDHVGTALIALKRNSGSAIPGEPVRAYEAG